MNDLSVELRFWIQTHLKFDGQSYVFFDGTRFEDFRAALQAVWLAGDRVLARELTTRYGMFNMICLCCASAHIGMPSSSSSDEWDYQLCNRCVHQKRLGNALKRAEEHHRLRKAFVNRVF